MDSDRPSTETSVKALKAANRELLAAMASAKRARGVLLKAEVRLRAAKRQLSLVVQSVAQP